MGKTLQNINILDITTASAQVLEGIGKIKNVNVLLTSKATSGLLASVSQQNVNVRAEVPENSVLSQVNGRQEIGAALNDQSPLFIVVNGALVIRPDATTEALEKGVSGILVNGAIFCPEKVKGIVQRKVVQQNGQLISYMDDADLVSDNVRIDNAYLRTLQADSRISFSGKAVVLDDVDASLLEEKLQNVEFMDKLIIREDLLPSISGKIVNPHKAKIVTVSGDTYYAEGELTLDAGTLRRIRQKRIYAEDVLRFESDVTPEELANSVDSLHSDQMIICSVDLKNEVLNKTADPSVQILAYTGKLRVVEGEYKLSSAELKYSKDPLSFIVQGVLDIAPSIDPQLLFDSLGSIVNFGVISGSGEQCGIVQTKLLKNSGVISDRDSEKDNQEAPTAPEADDGNIYIKNANYIKL